MRNNFINTLYFNNLYMLIFFLSCASSAVLFDVDLKKNFFFFFFFFAGVLMFWLTGH